MTALGACLAAVFLNPILWGTRMIWAAWLAVLADCAYAILRSLRSGQVRSWGWLIVSILFFVTGVWITVAHLIRR